VNSGNNKKCRPESGTALLKLGEMLGDITASFLPRNLRGHQSKVFQSLRFCAVNAALNFIDF